MLIGDHLHAVVGGAALPAEDKGKEGLIGLAGFGALLRHFQMTLGLGLDGGPYRVAAGEELVESEGKDGKTAGFTSP